MVKRVNGEKVFTLMAGKRILVVEDDRRNREALMIYLGGKGFDVTTATNGEEALEAVRQAIASGSGFDVYITDVNMPRMDGNQLVNYIRHELDLPDLPVLMVTSEDNKTRLGSLERGGVSALCSKPFETQNLKRLLHRILYE